MRIGIGYDVHRLVEGRKLILGGVSIPFSKGLLGHSDADVLIHAISDALLGALGSGDIGTHFPDTDPRYKNISSSTILEHIQSMAEQQGMQCVNVDATVVAEQPKLSSYAKQMAENISRCLKVPCEAVNIKAKTTEGLGFEGCGEGISSHAVVLIEKL
jgi:2-C-methyl-D-erythritol 2,4-cyclodiphosphate synthase